MKGNQGQVGMTVLLIMVVMVTVAVAVASRSVSNLNLTRREQESTRSLDLAESGIEQLLNSDVSITGSTTYHTVVQSGGVSKDVYISAEPLDSISELPVREGHVVDVFLGKLTSDLTVSWNGDCAANTSPVIELTFLKDGSPNSYAKRLAFDACDARCNVAGFTCTSGLTTANIANTDVYEDMITYDLLRVKVLAASTTLTVTGTGLPNQGVKATATASDSEEVAATVQKYQYRGSLPSIFDYVVFSGDTIETP